MDKIEDYICGNFFLGGKELFNEPKWNMSLKSAGSMRFRWNEENKNRDEFLKTVNPLKKIAAIELIHSKKIFYVKNEAEVKNLYGAKGDGIVCTDKNIVPVITVADCVPIYIFDSESKAFAVLHSGWKGTGICGEAVNFFKENFNSNPENICAVIGPHINECCYSVDKARAEYFVKNFGSDCVKKIDSSTEKYALSLTKANLNVLEKCGVPKENIFVSKECTCCSGEKFGSFRRETAGLPANLSDEERSRKFTVQCAWISW